jgi:hypothetical protein
MPVVNIKKNIQQLQTQILEMRDESLRVEGVLRTYKEFEKYGLTQIDVPHDICKNEEVMSIQEKPE